MSDNRTEALAIATADDLWPPLKSVIIQIIRYWSRDLNIYISVILIAENNQLPTRYVETQFGLSSKRSINMAIHIITSSRGEISKPLFPPGSFRNIKCPLVSNCHHGLMNFSERVRPLRN